MKQVAPAPPPPECMWTGFYIGGHAGYAWGHSSSSSDDDGFDEPDRSVGLESDGFVGGGQLGFNWQLGRFVIGLEGQGGWLDLDESKFINPAPDNFATVDFGWYATITPRIGFTWNRLLFYAKGGVDFVEVDNRAGDLDSGNIDPTSNTRHEGTEVSWTAGGGIEFCINPHWSVKVEYDYLDVNDTHSGDIDGDHFHHENNVHMVTAGINFHFWGGR